MLLIKSEVNLNDEFLDTVQKNLERLNEYIALREASVKVSKCLINELLI